MLLQSFTFTEIFELNVALDRSVKQKMKIYNFDYILKAMSFLLHYVLRFMVRVTCCVGRTQTIMNNTVFISQMHFKYLMRIFLCTVCEILYTFFLLQMCQTSVRTVRR